MDPFPLEEITALNRPKHTNWPICEVHLFNWLSMQNMQISNLTITWQELKQQHFLLFAVLCFASTFQSKNMLFQEI